LLAGLNAMTTAGGAATVSAVYAVLAFNGTIAALAIGFFAKAIS
jgi:hypothetical protein